ncbi:GTPase IMAP family member 4-like [Girardinichthys multiradiatus]|uniref:GTPase IMAP family member 4-like n=1 Tax=Girardinichthys multiradiatus TaxID=208333 RepID=UPI001FABF5EE|nr:GTPase IMAP family member 4-like [Girardinichthys multiradiatus]
MRDPKTIFFNSMDGSLTACCGLGAGRNNFQLPKRRIVIMGQTGAGKSSLGNTILNNKKFKVSHDPDSGMSVCETKTKCVGGREITLIDMPGLFDPAIDEKELKPALLKYITECSPGPHAFLIVLKVEEYAEKGKDIISKMNEYFSEEVFRYATVVFTHGNSLPRRQRIKDFVKKNKFLSSLVEKCGSRCHVVDNKHWSKRPKYEYRSNCYQVKKILKSIEKTVEENDGICYTNALLQEIEKNIQQKEQHIAETSRNIPKEKIRETAKDRVYDDVLNKAAGITTGALLGAVFGVATAVSVVVALLASVFTVAVKALTGTATNPALDKAAKAAPDAAEAAGKPPAEEKVRTEEEGNTAEKTTDATVTGKAGLRLAVRSLLGSAPVAGALLGGYTGYKAAEKAETPWEAAEKAAEAVSSSGFTAIETSQKCVSNLVNAVFKPLTKDS